jgi:pantoate--beta-alanine ligase
MRMKKTGKEQMKIIRTPAEVQGILSGIRRAGKRIGFVPTMGALHEGHVSLVRLARERTECVVTSIFVNPKQFGPKEDFRSYPRSEVRDTEILESLGCDIVFAPSDRDFYSSADQTRITVQELSDVLCGASRPDHFQGVVLVVAKLFNIVQPDEAYFGQKDAQQAVIIQRMTADLDFPIRIVIGPTVREPDGLALSSRNDYLTPQERKQAPALYRSLEMARRRIERGERDVNALTAIIRGEVEGEGIDLDYAEIVDGATLEPLTRVEGTVLLAVAGRIGRARLIDNIALTVSGDEVKEVVLEFPEWSRYGW